MYLLAFLLVLGIRECRCLLGGHRATLNFGRETNTWMPPLWAASGERVLFTLDIFWKRDGTASILNCRPERGLALGQGAQWEINKALWSIDGSTLRLTLEHQGFSVGDCNLEAGDLFLALPLFSLSPTDLILSSKPGIMTIVAYRFFIRKERRIVGIWSATPIVVEESLSAS